VLYTTMYWVDAKVSADFFENFLQSSNSIIHLFFFAYMTVLG
jgi:hypothetical protein